MNSLAGDFCRFILGAMKMNTDVPDKDAIAYVKYNKVSFKKTIDGELVEVVSHQRIVEMINKLESAGTGYAIGDSVIVEYNKEDVRGPIKEVAYRVKGAGNKYFKEEDIKEVS